jgi:large subunit ribosomal protein L30
MAQLQVKLKRSLIGRTKGQRATVKGLGLRHTGATVTLEDTPSVRGMVKKVLHLVEVTELA